MRCANLVESRGGEQVADERQEERLVLVDQLGEVHVAQDAHDDHRLRVLGVGPFRRAQRPQHRQNVAQSKVVVHLVDRQRDGNDEIFFTLRKQCVEKR